MKVDPHWIEYVRAFGPFLIAIFVAYIAWEQWKLGKDNLREKLFDKRFEVFKEVHKYLSQVLVDAKISDGSLLSLNDAIQRSRFLFGKSLYDYLQEIREHSVGFRLHGRKLEALPEGEERTEHLNKETDELKWLNDQLPEIFDKFEPFLGFNK